MKLTIKKHCVEECADDNPVLSGLSPLQKALLTNPAKIRIAHAPTGAGKSYAFQRILQAETEKKRILFIVPTRRLAQNLERGLIEDLKKEKKDEQAIKDCLRVWTSDETQRLKKEKRNAHIERLQEIDLLDGTREQSEIIISVPETVSQLILRGNHLRDLNDKSILDFIYNFDHIVFDEFHTIDERGFGLAGTFAKLISMQTHNNHAQLSFLSATPLDLTNVLKNLGIEKDFVVLKDNIGDQGRVIHGDVCLELNESPSMVETLRVHMDEVVSEINNNRQVVIIYNRLGDLQRHIVEELETLFTEYDIDLERCLLINSLDDSRKEKNEKGAFTVGRGQDPTKFNVLIATSSVEMGVTFKANLLFMESGFEPMNFLQRYGRAARGDHQGHVVVSWNQEDSQRLFWFQQLLKWVESKEGQCCDITELTQQLSQGLAEEFDPPNLKENLEENVFGALGDRAIYTTGLYWYALVHSKLLSKDNKDKLIAAAPESFKTITGCLGKLYHFQQERKFRRVADACKKWCELFVQQAHILRDIEPSITVKTNGELIQVSRSWIERETSIFEQGHIYCDEKGQLIVEVPNALGHYFRDERQHVTKRKTVYFPHINHTEVLEDTGVISLTRQWQSCLHNRQYDKYNARYHDAIKGAEFLVLKTGIIPSEYEENVEMDTVSGIF